MTRRYATFLAHIHCGHVNPASATGCPLFIVLHAAYAPLLHLARDGMATDAKMSKRGSKLPLFIYPNRRLQRIVHIEFDWMRGHAIALNFLRFQLQIGINHAVGEDPAACQECTILIQLIQRFFQ